MSVELVHEEISRFLSRADPEVLCIRGKWGVGKTYTWSKQLEASQKAGKIDLHRYSYVSLFGVNTLDELKFAIFENVITLNEGIKKANLETLDAYVSKLGSWRKLTRIASSLPVLRNVFTTDATSLISFMTICDQIICIDDLERRGQKLDVNDVLGLISYLREQRNCKVVLILNDQQLDGDTKRDFEKNLEKVVDVSVVYEPPPEVSVDIAVASTDQISKDVRDRCIALGITNIRVMKRVLRFIASIQPLLKNYDPDVLKIAISSIVLFSWSHDQPEQAPSLAYLKNKAVDKFGLRPKNEVPPEEAAWNSLLEAYGYTWTDDFDLVLLKGVCDGYFDPERVRNTAQAVHDRIIATKADGSFGEAWNGYHDSFDDNQEEVLDDLYESFLKNARYITPTNLNGTIKLFKELGRAEQAKELLDYYMANRNEDRRFFDLDDNPFGDGIDDEDVRAAFVTRAAEAEALPDLAAVMAGIKDGWNEDQLNALATASIDEYKKVFKSHSGRQLRRILANVLQFDRIAGASDDMRRIPQRAREALQQIGSESAINARRVARFGVKVESAVGDRATVVPEPTEGQIVPDE
ncbi:MULTISPECIES: P-loop NTPase fold protein [unclassified Beijerinckia]|uniref:P-loop NTPase fold protein n=1 Tax=unclassified Beijerinckia TaxID=2638183 RepID=UPI00089CA595|nr:MULTISPECIES: P-loop NTPase fold protein [unclassified Beijerinckia]MDH7794834.1 hypothetical protein [Beijerinckia sp. GAS462]SEB77006.1 hypothetical protein SAMN05443249_1108 [Beijerinckia sp. 28-YEA-48]